MPVYDPAVPLYPTLTSGDPEISTWKEGVSQDPTLRSPKTSGLTTTRAQFTRVPKTWSFSHALMSDADKQTLKLFESGVTKFGALSFYWKNFQEAYGCDAWVSGKSYILGQIIQPTSPNGRSYKCTTAGTSGGAQPSWPTTIYGTVVDGTAIWTENTYRVRFAQPLACAVAARIDFWDIDVKLEEI